MVLGVGVDTHLDVHVAVALDGLGSPLGELAVPTTTKGYEKLASWAEGFRPRKVRWGRWDRLLRRRARLSCEGRGDRGGGTREA